MGLDFEMAINEHYSEVMDVIDKLFVYIFDGLNSKHSKFAGSVLANLLVRIACVPASKVTCPAVISEDAVCIVHCALCLHAAAKYIMT